MFVVLAVLTFCCMEEEKEKRDSAVG
jgi:hypothetical protein